MAIWCRKFVLLLALAVLPLQGIAATLAVLLCHGEAQKHVVDAGNGLDHGVQPGDHHDDGSTAGIPNDHLCCHLTVSGPSVLTLPAALPEFPVRAYAPDPVHDLFVPDQPQRPPLA